MWAYDFMQHALMAGIIIATISAIISIFVVLRKAVFATHALGHMSITGAAGALICGVSAIVGQLLLNIVVAFILGIMGDKVKKNDLVVGVVLTFVLGCGAYFLFLYQNNYAGGVMSVLFGNILAVSLNQIKVLLGMAVIIVIFLCIIARPLLFASIDPTIAIAKNVPIKFISVIFFLLLAITVSMACQIVGALLVFALLVIPGAVAIEWGDGIYKTSLISVVVANFSLIASLYLAFYLNWPVSFCITTILSIIYFTSIIKKYCIKHIINKRM